MWTMILTSLEESFQNQEASGVIIDGKNTHSDGELVAGIIPFLLYGHFLLQSLHTLVNFVLWVWKPKPRSYETKETRKTIRKDFFLFILWGKNSKFWGECEWINARKERKSWCLFVLMCVSACNNRTRKWWNLWLYMDWESYYCGFLFLIHYGGVRWGVKWVCSCKLN